MLRSASVNAGKAPVSQMPSSPIRWAAFRSRCAWRRSSAPARKPSTAVRSSSVAIQLSPCCTSNPSGKAHPPHRLQELFGLLEQHVERVDLLVQLLTAGLVESV